MSPWFQVNSLKQLDPIPPSQVTGFGIEEMVHIASKVEPLAETQIEALGIAGVSTPDVDMSRLVDRLSAKVGARNVYRLEPVQSLCPSV